MSTLIEEAINTLKDSNKLTEDNLKVGTTVFGKTGTFTADATADAAHIYKDKTAYVNGNKVIGTMTPVKKFNTVQEMQADTEPILNGYAVVYNIISQNLTENWSSCISITLPEQIVFESGTDFSEQKSIYTQFDDSNNNYFNMSSQCWSSTITDWYLSLSVKAGSTTWFSPKYTTTDGLTFTLDPDSMEGLSSRKLEFSSIGYNGNDGTWDNAFSAFTYETPSFEGLYKYNGTTYVPAPTQFTLSSASELYQNIVAYGKNGTVTGDGSIWNNIDKDTLFRYYYNLPRLGTTDYYGKTTSTPSNITDNILNYYKYSQTGVSYIGNVEREYDLPAPSSTKSYYNYYRCFNGNCTKMLYRDSNGDLYVRDLETEVDTAVTTPLASSFSFKNFYLLEYGDNEYDNRIRTPNYPEGISYTWANSNIENETQQSSAPVTSGRYYYQVYVTDQSVNAICIDTITGQVVYNVYGDNITYANDNKFKIIKTESNIYIYVLTSSDSHLHLITRSGHIDLGTGYDISDLSFSTYIDDMYSIVVENKPAQLIQKYDESTDETYYECVLYPIAVGDTFDRYTSPTSSETGYLYINTYGSNIDNQICFGTDNSDYMTLSVTLDHENNTFIGTATSKGGYYICDFHYDATNDSTTGDTYYITNIVNNTLLYSETQHVKVMSLQQVINSDINDYDITGLSATTAHYGMGLRAVYFQLLGYKNVTTTPEYEQALDTSQEILGETSL